MTSAPAPSRPPVGAVLRRWLIAGWTRVQPWIGQRLGLADPPPATLELHEAVTQQVVAMVVQADAAQYLLSPPTEDVATGLTAISETGRRAIADLRALRALLTGPEQ